MNAMFKAVVWKELRANLKWGVVILLGMLVVLIFRMRLLSPPSSGPVSINGMVDTLEGVAAFGAILAGLLIGTAQAVAENRGDKWGFLAHRPASLSTLFWGKVTAGVLLCVVSVGIPVGVGLSWLARPGNLPVPFDWRIALPVIANLLSGLVCYFAGFLTGMRQARWYASRALGIAAAFGCIGWQVAVATDFWQAAAISAIGLIVGGAAAWSTFVAGGQYSAQPRIGRIATGLAIGLGLILVGYVALMVTRWTFQVPQLPPGLRTGFSVYTVTGDGLVVRLNGVPGRGILEVSDPAGRPLEQYRNIAPGQSPGSGVLTARLSPRPTATPSLQSMEGLYATLGAVGYGGPASSWNYVHRLGLIAVFDNQSRQHLGWMGPDGFSPGEARPRPFTGQLNRRSSYGDARFVLVFDDAVYRLDLERRSIAKIFEPEPSERILDAGSSQAGASALEKFGETAYFEAIATTRRVIVQLRDGTRLLELPQDPQKTRGYSSLQVSRAMRAAHVPTFLWYQDSSTKESWISEYNSAGAVVNSWTLPPASPLPEESFSSTLISAAVSPPVGVAALRITGRMAAEESSGSKPDMTFSLVITMVAGLASAVAAFLHGRSHALAPGRLYAWTGAALLLGLPGYLLMLALIEWPARESCSACSRKRVVTRERCEHCGAPFAVPPQDGTEIFDPLPEGR
jgi:hypothetical protein